MEHPPHFESLPQVVPILLHGTDAEKNAVYETFGAVSLQEWERYIHAEGDSETMLLVTAVMGKDLRLFRLLLEKRANHQVRPFREQTILIIAVLSESLDILRLALEELEWDDMINARDDVGFTALHYAVKNPQSVELLLRHGADPRIQVIERDIGITPLHMAVGMGNTASAALLLDYDGRLLLEKTPTVLDTAISLGYQPFIDLFIQRYMKYVSAEKGALSLHWILSTAEYVNRRIVLPVGSELTAEHLLALRTLFLSERSDLLTMVDNDTGATPLHCACQNPKTPIDVIQSLVDQDQIVLRLPDNALRFPIHLACRAGAPTATVRALVVDQDAQFLFKGDVSGAVPLHCACQNPRAPVGMIRFLVEQAPWTLFFSDKAHRLPIHIACRAGAPIDTVRALLGDRGAALLEIRDASGATPLHCACRNPRAPVEVIQFLVEQAPRVIFFCDNAQWFPIPIACRAGAPVENLRALVMDQGARFLVIADASGATPLHHACRSPETNVESIRFLVEQAPETIRQTDNAGNLPIHTACAFQSSLDIVKYLHQTNATSITTLNHQRLSPFQVAAREYANLDSGSRDVVFYLLRADPGFVLALAGHLP